MIIYSLNHTVMCLLVVPVVFVVFWNSWVQICFDDHQKITKSKTKQEMREENVNKLIQHVRSDEFVAVRKIIDGLSSNDLLELIQKNDSNGNTLLHIAVQSNSEKVACLLIERSFDPNAKNRDGETPMTIAQPRIRGMMRAAWEILQMKKEAFKDPEINTTETQKLVDLMNNDSV